MIDVTEVHFMLELGGTGVAQPATTPSPFSRTTLFPEMANLGVPTRATVPPCSVGTAGPQRIVLATVNTKGIVFSYYIYFCCVQRDRSSSFERKISLSAD